MEIAGGEKKGNWFAKHKVLTGILVLIVLAVIGSAINGASNSGKSTPAASDNSSPAASSDSKSAASNNTSTAGSSQSQAAKPAPTPQVLLDLTGKGTKTTQKFTAGSDWDLNWSYDCTAFDGTSGGNFQVMIYNGDGSMSLENAAVNQLGTKDSGVEHYHTGGTLYLTINSECSWTVQAKG